MPRRRAITTPKAPRAVAASPTLGGLRRHSSGGRRGLCCSLAMVAFTLGAAPAGAYEVGHERLVVTVGSHRVAVNTHGDVLPPDSDRGVRQGARRAARAARADDTGTSVAPSLASRWCGTRRSTDDTANDATAPGAAYKVVYAYPADQSSRLTASRYAYGSLIQRDVRAIADVFTAASGGAKTLRVDVGTRCGAQYVDIATVKLPHSRAHYIALDTSARLASVTSAVRGSLGPLPGVRNLLIYADSLRARGISGTGDMYADDRPEAANSANAGGLDAVVWGDGSSSFSKRGNRQTTALHEISHNLGAVQESTPHSSGASHCTDGYDVLCYPDRGSKAGGYTATSCAWKGSGIKPYDCGADDYFNPAPGPGSYLATHWNVFRSDFLCAPGACSTAGRSASATSSNQPPTAHIAVGGSPVAGTPVTLDATSSDDPDGAVAAYRWDIDGDGVTDSRAAAIDATFSQRGRHVVRLTVTDGGGRSTTTAQTLSMTPAPEGAAPMAQSGPGAAAQAVRTALRRAGLRGLARRPLTVKLPALDGGRITVALSAHGRRLARARTGARPHVRLALSRRARAQLRRHRAKRITVLVTATGTAGRAHTSKTVVTVRR